MNSFVGFIVTLFERIYEFVLAIWAEFGDDIVEGALAFLDFLVNQFEILFSFLGNIFDAGTSFLQGNWEDGLKFLGDAAIDAVRFILGAFLNLFEGIGRGVDALAEFFGFEDVDVSGFINDTNAALDGFLEGLKFNEGEDAGTDFVSGVTSAFGGFSGFSFGLGATGGGGGGGPQIAIAGGDDVVPSFLETGDATAGTQASRINLLDDPSISGHGRSGIDRDEFHRLINCRRHCRRRKPWGFSQGNRKNPPQKPHLHRDRVRDHVGPLAIRSWRTSRRLERLARPKPPPRRIHRLSLWRSSILRERGAVLGPTLALLGENPSSRGEFVIPFERMGDFLGQVEMARGPEIVNGRILAGDIHLSNQRADRLVGRRRIV